MRLNVTKVLAGAATATALTIALSGNALAHFGGMSNHMSGSLTSNLGNITKLTETNKVIGQTKVIDSDDHRRFRDRRFHFLRFGSVDLDPAPVCF
jgi:hypothetical protein